MRGGAARGRGPEELPGDGDSVSPKPSARTGVAGLRPAEDQAQTFLFRWVVLYVAGTFDSGQDE